MVDFKGKKVIVIGLARSGIGVLRTLKKIGAAVTVNDIKTEEQIGELVREFKEKSMIDDAVMGIHPDDLEKFDYTILSPGVPPNLDFIRKAVERGAEVIGELELSYLINPAPAYIGITGTNGKTTTTALTGEIFKNAGRSVEVVGNIGIPVISRVMESDAETVLITEISSFQLETIDTFKVEIAALLNITPDHLNRHGDMENYMEAKKRIFENQTPCDTAILNYDDEAVMKISGDIKSNKWYFSSKERVPRGLYVKDGIIRYNSGIEGLPDVDFIRADEIFMPGDHNVENGMAATLIATLSGIDAGTVKKTLREFRGVEHRIEYVGEIAGVKFFNDSKATNPDASVKAIEAMRGATVLIAGGMDKQNTFDDMIESFKGKVYTLVVYGETKEIIRNAAKDKGFDDVIAVRDLEEAVTSAKDIALKRGCKNVLLSPACASWDMYRDFEERGNHFKEIFKKIR